MVRILSSWGSWCDTPKPGVSVDYPSTYENSIHLISRDAYLSKNASWAHKPILNHGTKLGHCMHVFDLFCVI